MFRNPGFLFLPAALLVVLSTALSAQVPRSRITEPLNESHLRRLPRNTHTLARSEFDQGTAPASLAMDHMLLVLTPGRDRQQALATFLAKLHDPTSPQHHKWLTPQQFGEDFGVADTDIDQVIYWLASQGFQVTRVSNAKTTIEFSGTAGQVANAFHTSIHKYLVRGVEHWANAADPQIPAALASVVAGVSTLHSFRKAPQVANFKAQAAKLTANGPAFTTSTGDYALSPGDFARIYNINPVYQSGIIGAGTTIAVVARSNINLQDITDFRSAFNLSTNPPQVVLNGVDPGLVSGDEQEAVLDVSWSGAIAPGAAVKLVVSGSSNTTDGVDLSEQYIVDNNLADVMTESYGDCEAHYTAAEAQFYSSLAAQAAAQGITYTVASGDSGAEGCDDPGSKTVATGQISVNMLAATPYNVAVGGTQFNENGNYPAYWATSNASGGISALTYIPEDVWNESCLAAACGSANANIYAGGGGVSRLFTKPAWQTGVPGIPDDGARDLPDVSMTSAGHDFYLLCLDGSCTERRGGAFFSGIAGTSAATPSFAGVMALITQYTGTRQGQANYKLYSLAAGQDVASCNASDAATPPATGCLFYDVAAGNNAVPGQINYGSSAAKYRAAPGYDLATGLGSVNVANLVFGWNGGTPPPVSAGQISASIDDPSASNGTLAGSTYFRGWALANPSAVTAVNVSVDSVPYGSVNYGLARADICALYVSAGCPNVGWTFPFDTTRIADGSHTVAATVQTASGLTYSTSSTFTVANWTSANPMLAAIDFPNSTSSAFSSTAAFSGWAFNRQAAVSSVAVSVDGSSYGLAQYGGSRPDVCAVYPGSAGCPAVGWNFTLDTTPLAEGPHTLAITPLTVGGQRSTFSTTFSVANNPNNPITLVIDRPSEASGAFSGPVGFGGWAIGSSLPVTGITVTVDGVSYGQANLGGDRADVCLTHTTAPGCPNVGWNFAFDSRVLPNGLHLLGLKAFTAGGQFAVSTRSFRVFNDPAANPITLAIDTPSSSNSILLGSSFFSGWAISSSNIEGVAVAIDGVPYGTASYGSPRPDVCTVYSGQANCPNVGWSISVDTSRLSNGLHTMTATGTGAVSNPALTGTLSSTFTVANWTTSNPMKLSIDYPNSQTGPLSGAVGIGGWTIDAEAAVTQVTVAVDDTPLGQAFYGGARPDVCVAFPAAGCPNVGWNFFLDTSIFGDGTHTLAVTGTTAFGRSSTFTSSFVVANGSSVPLRIGIDNPSAKQTLSGTAVLAGWAVNIDGATVTTVDVLVDGELNGTAFYGTARPDVCPQFAGAGGCPNVGWTYNLDTAVFPNGSHTLEIRAAATDGRQYTAATSFNIGNGPL